MESFPGLDDTLFNQDPSEIECLEPFVPLWQEDEQVELLRPSAAERHDDGEQQQYMEEVEERLQPVESQPFREYNSDPEPSSEGIRYAIEWKALLKTKRIGTDTEQDVSLAPGAFGDTTLRKKVEDLLARKFSPQDRPEPDDTDVVVSVSKRAERDLVKEFVGFDIGWSIVEDKLESWGCHSHAGKRLTKV